MKIRLILLGALLSLFSVSVGLAAPPTQESAYVELETPPLPEDFDRISFVAEIAPYGYSHTSRQEDVWVTSFNSILLDRDAVVNILLNYFPSLEGIRWLDEPDQIAITRIRLKDKIATLRQWGQDSREVALLWDGYTQTQKDARVKILFDRMGIFFGNFADLIVALGIDRE